MIDAINTAIRNERLRELRRVMMAVPAEHLHMRGWSGEAECGTVRCAAGWAGIDPYFNNRGFRMSSGRKGGWPIYEDGTTTSSAFMDRYSDHDAVQIFFHLTERQSENLFGYELPRWVHDGLIKNPHAITKEMVISNIDRILDGQQPLKYSTMIQRARRESRKSKESQHVR